MVKDPSWYVHFDFYLCSSYHLRIWPPLTSTCVSESKLFGIYLFSVLRNTFKSVGIWWIFTCLTPDWVDECAGGVTLLWNLQQMFY